MNQHCWRFEQAVKQECDPAKRKNCETRSAKIPKHPLSSLFCKENGSHWELRWWGFKVKAFSVIFGSFNYMKARWRSVEYLCTAHCAQLWNWKDGSVTKDLQQQQGRDVSQPDDVDEQRSWKQTRRHGHGLYSAWGVIWMRIRILDTRLLPFNRKAKTPRCNPHKIKSVDG